MGKTVKLKKGFDINILGTPQKKVVSEFASATHAVKPTDFHGIAPIPKMLVSEGDEILAGDPLFFDKKQPDILFVSPVSGEVASIRRGEKRAIAEVVILADQKNRYRPIEKVDLHLVDRDELIAHMMKTGCWPFIIERPFGMLANPQETPKAIYISGFDSSPLANDYSFSVTGQGDYLQTGIDVLNILTGSAVHLGLSKRVQAANDLTHLKGVETHYFDGPHPAGNVGVQIHHIDPIGKGDVVWTVNLQDVIAIGRIYKDGEFNTERLFAVGGPVVENPQYYKSYIGASVENMVANNLKNEHVRYISGNVLTGNQIDQKGHLSFFDNQLTVLEEGDKYEPFGWLIPNYPRPSINRSFLSTLFGRKKPFDVNTNMHGEPRAMVVTGEYEKVMPMDLYPQQLLKSILYGDLDQMEGLGIYEVLEEDLALCEFVCTSKTQVQKILRDGLDMMVEQG